MPFPSFHNREMGRRGDTVTRRRNPFSPCPRFGPSFLPCQSPPQFLRLLFPLVLFYFIRGIDNDSTVPVAEVDPFRISFFFSRGFRASAVHPETAVDAGVKIGVAGGACVPEPHILRKFHTNPAGGARYLHFRPLNSFITSSAFRTDFFTHLPSNLPASSKGILSSSSPFSSLCSST